MKKTGYTIVNKEGKIFMHWNLNAYLIFKDKEEAEALKDDNSKIIMVEIREVK